MLADILRDKKVNKNVCTFPMRNNKITHSVDYNYWLKRLDTTRNQI